MRDVARPLRVYLVEDSGALLLRLIELLEGIGIDIVGHADTAAMAVREIRAVAPDVVIADIALRSGNGFDVLRALDMRDGAHPAPTMIMLSGYATRPYRAAAERFGATYYFDKSDDMSTMLQTVESMARNLE